MTPADDVAPTRRAQLLFVGIILSWLVFPLAQRSLAPQDGLAYLTAGRLVTSYPGAIYVHRKSDVSWQMDARYFSTACQLTPTGTNCAKVIPPFLSAPAALPLVAAPAQLGSTGGTLAIRELAVGALALGMWVLWRRRSPSARGIDAAFAIAAAFMTPFAYQMSVVGQASSLLFLAACLGLPDRTRRAATWANAATWAAAMAFKLFPAALAVLAIARRRWRLIGLTAAVFLGLSGLAAVLAPGSTGAFLHQVRPTTATQIANSANISIDGLVRLVAPGWGVRSPWLVPAILVRVATMVSLGVVAFRTADDDVLWAYGWVALLLIEPIVWWHYLGVLVALAAFVVDRRPDLVWAIPAAALPLVPLALTVDSTKIAWFTVLTLAVAVVAAAWSQRGRALSSDQLLPSRGPKETDHPAPLA